MRRILSGVITCIILVITLCPIKAYAGHYPAQAIVIDTCNFTDDACYIDLLIKMNCDDEYYTECSKANMDRFAFDKAQLAAYRDEDGYISFSCHYKDIYTDPIISKKTLRDRSVSQNCFTLGKDLKADLSPSKKPTQSIKNMV